jgi:PBP1b-binding outer membrane lipoprotein LpoB
LFPFFKKQKETLNNVSIDPYPGVSMRRDVYMRLTSTLVVLLFVAICLAGCTNQAPAVVPTAAPTTAAPVVTITVAAPDVNVTANASAANVTIAAPGVNVTAAAPAANVTAAAPVVNATSAAPTGGPGRTN